jgi:hypothetical protein
VNGALQDEVATSPYTFDNNDPLYIGGRDDAGTTMTGQMCGVAYFRSELTAARVIAHYNAGNTVPAVATAVTLTGATVVKKAVATVLTLDVNGTYSGGSFNASLSGGTGSFSANPVTYPGSPTSNFTPSTAGNHTITATPTSGTLTPGSITLLAYEKLTGTVIGTTNNYNNDPTYSRDKAFDGNFSTFPDTGVPTGCWLGLDLGVAKTFMGVGYAPRASFGTRMVGGKIQASNSATFASGVVDLFTIAAPPTEGVLTVATFTAVTTYRYVRYLSPDSGYNNVSELEFYGVNPAGAPATPNGGMFF